MLTYSSLRWFHPIHPIVAPSHIWEIHKQAYQDVANPVHSNVSNDDSFKILMVFALGSVPSHCSGAYDKHPFGYFAAGLKFLLSSGFAFSTLSELQNFLLIARFGTYHYIGKPVIETFDRCVF